MKRSEPLKTVTATEYPYPARVLLSSFPVAMVILPVLWLTGYPPEEWPFVSGVFALSLLGSGTMIGCAAMLAISRVYNYACTVAAKRGIDPHQPNSQTSGSRRLRIISAAITMLLLIAATWGLAWCVLALVMAQLDMAPIGTHFPMIALAILAAGAVGFSLFIGGLAWFFRTADRNPQKIRQFSAQFQNWMNVTGHIGQRRRISGVPNLTGSHL